MVSEIIGKFHPLVVHLPIGFITLTLILVILSKRKPEAGINKILPDLLALCFLSALIATITGYVMPKGNEFSETLLSRHFWSAVMLTVISGLMLVPFLAKFRAIGYWLMGGAMVLSGHFGGSLTHGEEYFSLSDRMNADIAALKKDGTVYQDLIMPILTQKCISCHNNSKSKGGLKMHDFSHLMKGGKSGLVVMSGNPDESEMVKRVLLPLTDEHHMPPKGRSQLTEAELAVIQYWIKNGADKTFPVSNIPKEDAINQFISLVSSQVDIAVPELPAQKPVDAAILQSLASKGVVMIPLDAKKNLYKANFTEANPETIAEIKKIGPNILTLLIQDKKLTNEWTNALANLTNIQSISLTSCTFPSNTHLKFDQLKTLKKLNLTSTQSDDITTFRMQLPSSITQVYLYNSNLKNYFLREFRSNKTMTIDTGGYLVPTLPSDTTRI